MLKHGMWKLLGHNKRDTSGKQEGKGKNKTHQFQNVWILWWSHDRPRAVKNIRLPAMRHVTVLTGLYLLAGPQFPYL